MWFSRRLFAVFALFGAVAMPAAFPAAPAIGERFPDLSDYGLDGELPDISSARVVIVDFWASWCAPCKASFPVFDELHDRYADRGLAIVGVSIDRNEKAMRAFLERAQPRFAVVWDRDQAFVRAMNIPGMPTSYVIDGSGRLRYVHEGFHGQKSRKRYIEEIERLLKEVEG
ncbi:MAG: TlpA family protein disulfide reductase [Verrucomicrobia bacterium]|nr:MAG: TlpA family protein disulfide reductase [Verrucomicrobiota bacterium]